MPGKYNTWVRKALATHISKYNDYWHTSREPIKPIAWTVPFYADIDSPSEVKELLIANGYFIGETDFNLQFPDFEYIPSQAAYDYAQERLVESLKDDEGLRTWSPDTAKKYCFDYSGLGADRPFSAHLTPNGRSGKHVCLLSFEGFVLDGHMQFELVEIVLNESQDYHVSNLWCRQLLGMLSEWDAAFTVGNVTRCGQYYMTDYIAREMGVGDWGS